MAAGPLYYRRISIRAADTVLKIIQQGEPVRTTRRHTKKTMTPLLFLKHTTSVTVGFHLDSALPNNWMEKLRDILPAISLVEICAERDRCKICGRYDDKCRKAMWTLAGTLGASQIAITINDAEGYDHYDGYGHGQWFALPNKLPDSLETIAITLANMPSRWPDLFYLFESVGFGELGNYLKGIPNIKLLLPPKHGNFVAGSKASDQAIATAPVTWNAAVPSMQGISEWILQVLEHSKSTTSWYFYMLTNFFPQEASLWPENLRLATIKDNTSIPAMVHRGLEARKQVQSTTPIDASPSVTFRTRDDFFREYYHLHSSRLLWSVIEQHDEYTQADYGDVTGLFGNWEL